MNIFSFFTKINNKHKNKVKKKRTRDFHDR